MYKSQKEEGIMVLVIITTLIAAMLIEYSLCARSSSKHCPYISLLNQPVQINIIFEKWKCKKFGTCCN